MLKLRYSIAGLMGVVVVAALGLTALRNPTDLWAGATTLTSCAVLALGVVGLVCRGKPERAWWLGFVLFGWGYLVLAFLSDDGQGRYVPTWLPTVGATRLLMDKLGAPPNPLRGFHDPNWFAQVVHSLWSLIAAMLGGIVAHALFSSGTIRTEVSRSDSVSTGNELRASCRRPALIGLVGPVVVLGALLLGKRSAAWPWAGSAFLLTWASLGLSTLGALFGRPRSRAIWFGAALFGAGYMILIFGKPGYPDEDWPRLATNRLLSSLRPWLPACVKEFPAGSDKIAEANAWIVRALDRPVSPHFPEEIPFETFVAWVKDQARSPDGKSIAIHIEPKPDFSGEITLNPTVSLDLEDVPLSTCLHLALKQLALTYCVKEGVIEFHGIYTGDDGDRAVYEDPFLVAGQCLLAWIAAGVGGAGAYVVADRRGIA